MYIFVIQKSPPSYSALDTIICMHCSGIVTSWYRASSLGWSRCMTSYRPISMESLDPSPYMERTLFHLLFFFAVAVLHCVPSPMDPSSRRGQLHQHATSSHGVGNLKPFCACRERPDLRSAEWMERRVVGRRLSFLSVHIGQVSCAAQKRYVFSVDPIFLPTPHTPLYSIKRKRGATV